MIPITKNKVLQLIALGPSAAEASWKAPEGVDRWGIQYVWKHWKLDRAFVMDDEEWIVAKNHSFTVPIDIEQEMRDAKCPIYVSKKWKNVENTVEFPIDKVRKEFPVKYFMNSMAYMFALAILEGYERIECYGMDLRYYNELGDPMKYHHYWLDETHCAAFWAGIAIGRGIEVVTTKRSSMMKPVYPGDPSLYGYEVSPKIEAQRKDILSQRKKVELKEEPEKLMIFRPKKGEDMKEFMKNIELGIIKPVGTTKVKEWKDVLAEK